MNPILVLVVILILSNNAPGFSKKTKGNFFPVTPKPLSVPPYFDTFRMELLLDKLKLLTNSLEKINHVNQMSHEQDGSAATLDRVHESLDAVKDLLADNKAGKQLDSISNTLAGLRQFGDLEELKNTVLPLLNMFFDSKDRET